jgi:hypothetical protein
VEAAIEKKLHPDFGASEYEEEEDIDDGIEIIHDEDESMFREGEEESKKNHMTTIPGNF